MDEEIAEDVRKYGYSSASISDHKPPFRYTIGLMQTYNHPELIVFGLEPKNSQPLFSRLVRAIRAGQSFSEPGAYKANIRGKEYPIGCRYVHSTQHPLYLGFAMGFCTNIGRIGQLQAVQVFWPDKAGKYPFDMGCDLSVFELQPRLDLALTPSEIEEFQRSWR